jgi:hypothetical protein
MRFMVIVPASAESEAGKLPSPELLAAMQKFNEELVAAGVMLAGEGLAESAKGARVRFEGKKRTVVDGPFTESKELVAGFWIWQCKSKDEAIEWAKRIPCGDDQPFTIEIRQCHESADFEPMDPTGELRQKEQALREKLARKP